MNRKFLIINKLFLSIFIMGVFSWLGFVNAQTCPASEWASNSNGWDSYTTTITSTDQELRYINKPSTINSICALNPNCLNYVCNELTAFSTSERKTECSSNMSSLFDKQLVLWNKYNATKNNMRDWWYGGESIKNLQKLMQEAWCQDHVDCKLGVKTSHAFLFCPVCKAINNDRKDLDVNGWCDGHWDYVKTEDNLCCQPIPSDCLPWIWVINNPGGDKYTSNDSEFVVYIDFSSNSVWDLIYNFSKIDIQWATLEWTIGTADDNNKKVLFAIKPKADANQIDITVQEWFATLWIWWGNCPATIESIYRDIQCQERDKYKDCDDWEILYDPIPEDPIKDYSFLSSIWECKKVNWDVVPFCECTTPGWVGCNTYGTWRFDDGNWCCKTCGSDQIQSWTVCKCTDAKCWKDWYERNPDTCKCGCDPKQRCCGIELNTVVPFIGDCIEMTTQNNISDPNDPNKSRVNQLNAFPFLMMGLSKILVTVILIFSFLIVIVAWLMMTTWVAKEENFRKWIDMVKKIVVALILLWSSGLILKLINPNFFGL